MKLIRLKNGNYRVLDDGRTTIEGHFEYVQQYLLNELGMEDSELADALDEMHRYQHDTADFGVNLRWTHTCNTLSLKHALTELQAIRDLRQEFHDAQTKDPNGPAARDAWNRLLSMYFCLNVEALFEVLGDDPIRFVA